MSCGDTRILLELAVRRVSCPVCGGVKRERLEWLAESSPLTGPDPGLLTVLNPLGESRE